MRSRILQVCLATGLASSGALVAPAQADDTLQWWAAGDSFSSGEGIRGSGVSGTGRAKLCAQSNLAFGPKAGTILKKVNGIDSRMVFTACTGAVTSEFYNSFSERPVQQTWAAEESGDSGVDVLTMSFGGNDIDFPGVLKGCIKMGTANSWSESVGVPRDCPVTPKTIAKRITDLAAGEVPTRLGGPFGPNQSPMGMADFYARVANSHLGDDGLLVIAGYPRLFAPSSTWQPWRHGRCSAISAADTDMLGEAAELLDRIQRDAVAEARKKLAGSRDIRFVSRLDIFDDGEKFHGVCSPTSEWINGTWAILSASGGRLENTIHPNRSGHQVTAEAVAGVVADHLDRIRVPEPEIATPGATPPPPPSETPAPLSDGTSLNGPGDPFESYCSVAWPTAPTYTSTSIILTMTCSSSPESVLFTQVTYPDPNLPINPSTGRVLVRGTVVEEVTSAYGYRTLIVQADFVDLDPS